MSVPRLDIDDIVRWQDHRDRVADPQRLTFDAAHNVTHIAKALGPLAACAERRDHGEEDVEFEEKRAADLIIHAIWLVRILGLNPAKVVAERVAGFDDGFSRAKGDKGLVCQCTPEYLCKIHRTPGVE